jgi:glycosyltransferase involved in cell wall biosynthesis
MQDRAKDPPLVSVVVPVYNGERYLAEAIQSLLEQEHRPLEVLVIDDGSTDGSARVAQQFGPEVHYHRREHAGLAGTRNHGTQLARGALLAFVDADDMWVPGRLARQVAALEAEPELDGVFGRMEQFVSPELDPELQQRLRPRLTDLPALTPSTLLIRTSAYRRVAALDPQWTVGEFLDWLLRARELGLKTRMLDQLVLRRRIHADNMGRRERDARGDYARILMASLKRRRGGAQEAP